MSPADRHLLLVTTDDGERPGGGRELLSRLLHGVLGELYASVTTVRLTGRTGLLAGLQGRLNGFDAARAELTQALGDPGLTQVFIDGSNLGAVAALSRQLRPDLPVATFFHNCETRFFSDAFRVAPGLRSLGVMAGHWRAECMALRHSQCRITLSERDSAELARRFGLGGTSVAAMALDDTRDPAAVAAGQGEPYALFVGGGFFGNVEGLRWYAREVAPRLKVRTMVVGRGLDLLAGTLPETMELVGPVDDLSPWYAGASVVVAPILSGSGMKTKVAEALMHGKRVVGTREAFSGYGETVLAANCCVDEPEQFAAAINSAVERNPPPFDPALLELYERFHSRSALKAALARALT